MIIKSNKPKNQAINDMASVSARSFKVEEIERFAGSLGNPSHMVANYAGVAMTNDSRNDIIISRSRISCFKKRVVYSS